MKITFEGETLIPCGLTFELYNHDNTKENYIAAVPFDSISSNEKVINVYVNLDKLPVNSYIDGRLLYGNGGITNTYSIYKTGSAT